MDITTAPTALVIDRFDAPWGETFRDAVIEEVGVYGDGRRAVAIRSKYGEPLSTVSVNLVDRAHPDPAGQGWFHAKTWSENEGLVETLVAAGVLEVREPRVEVPVGPYGCVALVARLARAGS